MLALFSMLILSETISPLDCVTAKLEVPVVPGTLSPPTKQKQLVNAILFYTEWKHRRCCPKNEHLQQNARRIFLWRKHCKPCSGFTQFGPWWKSTQNGNVAFLIHVNCSYFKNIYGTKPANQWPQQDPHLGELTCITKIEWQYKTIQKKIALRHLVTGNKWLSNCVYYVRTNIMHTKMQYKSSRSQNLSAAITH